MKTPLKTAIAATGLRIRSKGTPHASAEARRSALIAPRLNQSVKTSPNRKSPARLYVPVSSASRAALAAAAPTPR
jgi:hypothetical protein